MRIDGNCFSTELGKISVMKQLDYFAFLTCSSGVSQRYCRDVLRGAHKRGFLRIEAYAG